MAGNRMKQAASAILTYFAVTANTEPSKERRAFARNAGSAIADAVGALGANKIILKNANVDETTTLEARYDLAKEALHSSQSGLRDLIKGATKFGESDYRGGWTKLKETLKEQMDETLKLAGDVDSFYSKQNGLILELAEKEMVGNPGEKMDRTYVGLALNYLGAANIAVAAPAQMLFGNELSKFSYTYALTEPSFSKKVEGAITGLNTRNMEYGARFGAATDVLAEGKKVTKDEFADRVDEYKQKLGTKMDSARKQMETALKNPQSVFGGQTYEGSMFG